MLIAEYFSAGIAGNPVMDLTDWQMNELQIADGHLQPILFVYVGLDVQNRRALEHVQAFDMDAALVEVQYLQN